MKLLDDADADSAALLSSDAAEDGVFVEQPPSPWRWWILATYSLLAGLQGATWGVPGVIEPSLQAVYGMSDDTVQLLLNYGPIWYLPFALPVMWHMDRHGIRGTVLSGIVLVVAANVMRCFANDSSLASIVIVHLSFTLNGIAGPVAMAVPSKLAEDWFQRDERTTATAIAALSNQSGNVFLYLLVPLLVPDTSAAAQLHLNLFLAALSVLNAVMFVVYFPSHPPRAPTASARVSRSGEERVSLASLWAALGAMARNPAFSLLTAVYSLIVGFSNCVGGLLTRNLQVGLNLSPDRAQVIAGWVGSAGNAGSIVMGVTLAALTDRLRARSRGALKAVLVGACTVCGVSYLVYAATLGGLLPAVNWGTGGIALAASSFTLANVALGALIPLIFDCCAEQCWPLPEVCGGGGGGGVGAFCAW